MGFKPGACATVWEISPSQTGRSYRGKITISKKNVLTGQWEPEFNGYVTFAGDAFQPAASLKPDRIWIEFCDVTNRYDKEKKREYTNFSIFSFTTTRPENSGYSNRKPAQPASQNAAVKQTGSGPDMVMSSGDDELPWG